MKACGEIGHVTIAPVVDHSWSRRVREIVYVKIKKMEVKHENKKNVKKERVSRERESQERER